MDEDELQKPKPSTDGKHAAGHSYSTRSKIKRTLHSETDDASSGLEEQQPPLKRQTRPGAKQVGESMEIINDETPESNAVDTNTVEENTPAQIALQNDLVLELLFRYVNRSDLLSCRVVNKQWQYEATKELRRRKLVIRFSFQSKGDEKSRKIAFQDVRRRLKKCRTPSLLSSFQVKTFARNDLGAAGVKSFFTTFGNQMKHLTLHLNYSMNWSFFERSSLITHLQNLLCIQAPNLEFLEIEFDFPRDWKDELEAFDSSDHHQNGSNEFGLLPNLNKFLVTGTAPPKFFADVITAAVNLRFLGGAWSISLSRRWHVTLGGGLLPLRGFSSEYINYFLGAAGRDKIHLLKSLRVYLANDFDVQSDERDIELIETFLTEHKQNLQLETIECVSRIFYKNVSFSLRIVNVINQILEYSAGSLTKLRIEPAKWFEDLLVIPRLPKLQEICFDCFWSSMERLDGGGFFPREFNMNISFPNVSTIVLLRCAVSFFRLFVERMKIEVEEPVPSILRIIVIVAFKDSCVPPQASDFHHVFPNLVSISYVNSDNYIKI